MQWVFLTMLGTLPAPAIDWAFVEAQETFVMDSAGIRSAVRSLSPESRALLAGMSADDWRHREWASREMARRGDVRACLVGQYLPDPEIRLRCRNVLRGLSRCVQCGGEGGRQETWGLAVCHHCRGVGHFWPVEDYTD